MKSKSSDPGRSVSRRAFVAGAASAAAAGMLGSDPLPLDATQSRESGIASRAFGNTGVRIRCVGLGAGSRFYGSIPDDAQAAELVRRAIDLGIDFIETSANYGPDGLSERRIGLAMETHRDKVFLETKVDERTYDGAMREMERSLTRMKTDHLDLVLHHNIAARHLEEISGSGGAERALREMADQKVVRFVGFSTHLPDVALAGMEQLGPDAVQLPINASRVPDFEAEVLPRARAEGVAVIAMKTCGHGYFHKANATVPDRIDQYGAPPEVLARWDLPTYRDYIHYALTLPISTATIGIDSPSTLEGIVAAARDFEPLSGERMASIAEKARAFATTGYWVPRAG